jgi:hypothetical protein
VGCAEGHEKKQVFHHEQLLASGFEREGNTNMYRKGGVAVTLGRTVAIGTEKAIAQHGFVLAQAEQPAAKGVDGAAQG